MFSKTKVVQHKRSIGLFTIKELRVDGWNWTGLVFNSRAAAQERANALRKLFRQKNFMVVKIER